MTDRQRLKLAEERLNYHVHPQSVDAKPCTACLRSITNVTAPACQIAVELQSECRKLAKRVSR